MWMHKAYVMNSSYAVEDKDASGKLNIFSLNMLEINWKCC
jgi:hypothetical protein